MTYPDSECVLMRDGRFVDFPTGRKILSSQYIDVDGAVCVRLDFLNGETRTFKVRADMLLRFAAEGAEHLLRASALGERDIDTVVTLVDQRISQLNGTH
jgi:hypothetical protein